MRHKETLNTNTSPFAAQTVVSGKMNNSAKTFLYIAVFLINIEVDIRKGRKYVFKKKLSQNLLSYQMRSCYICQMDKMCLPKYH